MCGAKSEDGGARERMQEVPSHPLLLWVTASSPAFSYPAVTPTPPPPPGWAVHPGWWKGTGSGRGFAPAFVMGMWGRRDGWLWGSSGLLSEHGVLPYLLAPRSGATDHPCALQAGDSGTWQVWCEGTVWGSDLLSSLSYCWTLSRAGSCALCCH